MKLTKHVLAELDTLRTHLHDRLEAHSEPVVMSTRKLLPIGGNAAWWNIGDPLVQAVARIYRQSAIYGATFRIPLNVNVVDEIDRLCQPS